MVVGKGSIYLFPPITLNNVIHVLQLTCNLLLVSELTKDQNCAATFYQFVVQFRAHPLGRRLGVRGHVVGCNISIYFISYLLK